MKVIMEFKVTDMSRVGCANSTTRPVTPVSPTGKLDITRRILEVDSASQ